MLTCPADQPGVKGDIAQWLERLTADQQVPGSNPGAPSAFMMAELAGAEANAHQAS